MTWLLACAVPDPDQDTAAEPEPVSVASLWEPGVGNGTVVTLDRVIVTSPRTAAGDVFYVQAEGGGPQSGVRVTLQGAIVQFPPAVGTPVSLTGPISYSQGRPVLALRDDDDGEDLGKPEEPTVDPLSDEDQGFGLVVAVDVQVNSPVDAAGLADLSGSADLCADFVHLQADWMALGSLTGILDNDLCPRTTDDWFETTPGTPWLNVSIADVVAGDLPEGTAVFLTGVSQSAPWTTDARLTVVQDATGAGLWVDAEASGLVGAPGLLATWSGELRSNGEGIRLRTWLEPTGVGAAAFPLVSEATVDGAFVFRTVSGLGAPDEFGNRVTADGTILDDRFGSLAGLVDPTEVTAWVRNTPGAVVLAVVPPDVNSSCVSAPTAPDLAENNPARKW